MIRRRRYLEAVAGSLLTAGAGCLAANDRTARSKTSSVESGTSSAGTTGTTTNPPTSSGVEQTTTRTSPTERTTTRANETEPVRSVPSASFTFDRTKEEEEDRISITHAGGDSIPGNRVTVTIEETIAFEAGDVVTSNYREVTNEWSETLTPDDTLAVRERRGNDIAEGQTVNVEWSPENGDSSVLVARFTIGF